MSVGSTPGPGSGSNRSSAPGASSPPGSSQVAAGKTDRLPRAGADKPAGAPALVSPQAERYRSGFQTNPVAGVKLEAPAGPTTELSFSPPMRLDDLKQLLDRTPIAQQKAPFQFTERGMLSGQRMMMAPAPSSPSTTFSKTPSRLPTSSFQKPPPAVAPPTFASGTLKFEARDGYPAYAQGSDMPWAADRMGQSSKSMQKSGCAVSAVAMALSGITGRTITPGELNAHLSGESVKGYTGSGDIRDWKPMGHVAGLDVKVTRQAEKTFNADRIDAQLAKGRPVVVQVEYKNSNGTPGYDGKGDHWILVTGRDANGQYQANDPAGGQMITLHRNEKGQLTANELPSNPKYTVPYVTTGNATTFDRGAPAAQAGVVPEGGRNVPIPMPAPDRAGLAASGPRMVNGLFQPSAPVEAAIAQAASTVGVDYGYLKAQAFQESTFNPEARPPSGSAAGLYQFMPRTWLEMVKTHGAAHGMGDLAEQIHWDKAEREYVVDDATQLQQILDRRTNPVDSALMAAEFAQGNQAILERKLVGMPVGATELYAAHFLGAGGATKFLGARYEGNGSQAADALLPKEAKANKKIFYDPAGRARSVDEVYTLLHEKIAPNANAYSRPLNPS